MVGQIINKTPPSEGGCVRDGSGPFFCPRVGFLLLRSSSGRVLG